MEDLDKNVQEMQILDQNLHNLLLQKQAFQMELSEIQSALKEIEKSEEVFKLIGDLLISSDKEKASKELSDKEKLLGMRIRSIEKQEDSISKRIEELRKNISNSVNRVK